MQKYLCLIFLGVFCLSQAQDTKDFNFDLNYFKGYIPLHNNDILGLIQGQPEGFILSYNKKTFGKEEWEQRYNYPDYGASLIYQNLKNDILGSPIGVYGHYNFYFLKRQLVLRIGQGIAYTSNPYDKIENSKNIAFGSHLLSSTYVMLNYKRERIFDLFGFQAGISFVHYSNANIKAPNTSVNTLALNMGLTYDIDKEQPEYVDSLIDEKFEEPLKYNFVFRTGINQSDVLGTSQHAFYIFSAYTDKRLSRKSAVQFGTEVFFSNFLKEQIAFDASAQFTEGITGDEDYKRLGVFVGHELFVNRFSVLTQLGYYAYYPFEFENRVYLRAGLKRYFGDKWFGALTLKSHGAKAEALEFGVGVRL